MSAKFLISILTYRMESGVEKCIESVLKGGGTFGLHLTANGCPAAAEFFESCQNRVTGYDVIVNSENLGFLIPNNRAMCCAQAREYDYLVLLNDDCEVPSGWLAAIEAEFERHPSAAIVGARGACRSLTNDFHGYNGGALEYIEGSACAVKVSVIKKHFKTLFPSWLQGAYCEDTALSLEVRKRGYSIHEACFTVVHHRGSTSKHVPEVHKWQEANRAMARKVYEQYLKVRSFSYRIVVRRWAAAGDVLLVTPVIRKLWMENPLAEICVETFFPEIFSGNPCVALAAKQIQRVSTDLEINLDMVSENAPMRHFVTSYARAAGVELEPPFRTEIYWKDDPCLRLTPGKWVALHTGPSTWPAKEWHREKWRLLIASLRAEGWRVQLVGNGRLPGFPALDADLDMRDQTKTLNELAALLSHCQLFIGIDSAPGHVASAVGIPAITIHGITDSRYILTGTNAVGVNADPTHYPRAGERHRVAGQTMIAEDGTTINSITVDDVLKAVKEISK